MPLYFDSDVLKFNNNFGALLGPRTTGLGAFTLNLILQYHLFVQYDAGELQRCELPGAPVSPNSWRETLVKDFPNLTAGFYGAPGFRLWLMTVAGNQVGTSRGDG